MQLTSVTVTGIRSDEGSVVIFEGLDDQDNLVTFAVDHGPARNLGDAVIAYLTEDAEAPEVELESWQLLGVLPSARRDSYERHPANWR